MGEVAVGHHEQVGLVGPHGVGQLEHGPRDGGLVQGEQQVHRSFQLAVLHRIVGTEVVVEGIIGDALQRS